MSDLLSYSLSHSTQRKTVIDLPVSLPPITTPAFARHTLGASLRSDTSGFPRFVLPPLHDLSNFDAKLMSDRPVKNLLTESNLYTLTHCPESNTPNFDGLGLLSSTVASIYSGSGLPSLSLSHSSILLSPSLSGIDVELLPSPKSVHLDHISGCEKIHLKHSGEELKRRQRQGPSCDSCRVRKVKCDALVEVVEEDAQNVSDDILRTKYGLSRSQVQGSGSSTSLVEGRGVQYIYSSGKVIRLNLCKSCLAKHQVCCFSKGFFKEDLVKGIRKSGDKQRARSVKRGHLKLYGDSDSSAEEFHAASLAGLTHFAISNASRKTSCKCCRQRKVRCVISDNAHVCAGCIKRNHACEF